MPKFIYVNETYDHESSSMREFIGPYPGPKLFKANKLTPSHKNVWSSNTIMAIPYHASAILELFYLSNQQSDIFGRRELDIFLWKVASLAKLSP